MYEFTTQVATLEPPPREFQELIGAMDGDQKAMDEFMRVNAGVTSPAEFFSPENVGRIFAAAGARIASWASPRAATGGEYESLCS